MAGLLILLAGDPSRAGSGAPSMKERSVKAAFVLNFGKFTGFPNSRFPKQDAPLFVSVLGDPLDQAVLNTIIKRKPMVVNNHSLTFRPAGDEVDPTDLHIAYFSNGAKPGTLGRFKGLGVLTIGNTEEFWREGGIIQFVERDGRVRFRINLKRAREEKLNIRAQLLKLAVEVKK